MPPPSFLTVLAELPLHAQLMLGAILTSGLACLVLVIMGALRQRWQQHSQAALGLPPLPRAFPYTGDQIFTALFCLFLLWGAARRLFPAEAAEAAGNSSGATFGWGAFLLGIAAQIGIYLPMLLRYAALHPLQRPTRPWWHYLALPAFFWMVICLSIGMLEYSGLSSWLIEKTGCPEHQELVLIFSRGDAMQRLYIIICAVFIAPVAEECCFRGFLYRTLKRRSGCVGAALASAFLFGAIHSSLAQLLPLTLFGIAQCIAYEKTRSLWLPIAVHMLFNTTSLIATAVMLP